jgi:hypothetical protein
MAGTAIAHQRDTVAAQARREAILRIALRLATSIKHGTVTASMSSTDQIIQHTIT